MPLVPSTHGDRCRPEAEPAWERVHLCGVRDERGKEVKRKKLAKLARKFEQITIALEELADDVQGNICALDGSPLRSIREAVRYLDNAVFYLDEHACRK